MKIELSNKNVVILIFIGFATSVFVSLLISKFFSQVISDDIRARDLDFLFGAVEAGPLALAKLHSSVISQQSLDRIMSTPALQGRGIESVQILGGEKDFFVFANWKNLTKPSDQCLTLKSRDYAYRDALFKYEVRVEINKCISIEENKIIFLYSGVTFFFVATFSIILIFIAVWPVVSSIKKAEKIFSGNSVERETVFSFAPIESLIRKSLKNIELERGRALGDIAVQVSHDLASPISVLNMLLPSIGIPSETKNLLLSALERINSISSDLLRINRKQQHHQSLNSTISDKISENNMMDLVSTIKNLVDEKKIEFEKRANISIILEIEDNSLMTLFSPIVITRIVSNLINNSVEAINGREGKVKIALRSSEEFSVITIIDDGPGIPKEILGSIGIKGFTVGKEKGNGLGIHYAKTNVEKSGGVFEVISYEGRGTMIIIRLPKNANIKS